MRFLACGSGGWALGTESRGRAGTQQAPPPASGAILCFLSPPWFSPVRSEFSGAWSCCHRTAIPPILTARSPWAGGGGPVEPPPGLVGGVGLNEAIAGPAGPSVYPGPSEVALGFSFRLDQPSRRRRWGAWGSLWAMVWVSLEAPGNKQPLPFWVLVSMAMLQSLSLPRPAWISGLR